MVFFSHKKGLTAIIQPRTRRRDEHGNVVISPGKKIEFRDGRYETEDPTELLFLQRYVEKCRGEIFCISEQEQKMSEIVSKAIKDAQDTGVLKITDDMIENTAPGRPKAKGKQVKVTPTSDAQEPTE